MNLTDAPVDSAVLTTIQRSRAFQNVEARFHLYASFVRGYLEAMPQSQRDGIKIYFANELRAIVRHFINYSVRDENSHLVNLHELNPDLELNTRRSNRNLVRRLRSLFPASVLHCIDRSEF